MNNGYNNGQNNQGFGEQNGNSWTNNRQSNQGFGEQNGNSWTNNGQSNPGFGESSEAQQNNGTQQNGTTGQSGYTAPGTDGQGYYYQTPIDPNSVTPRKSGKDYGATAQTLGIIGLVASFLCSCLPIVGLILGIVAVVNGKRAAREDGQDKNAGTTGRVCGIIAIVISAVAIVVNIVFCILTLAGLMDTFWEEYYRQLQVTANMVR